MKGTAWGRRTVIKALEVRLSCGARGYKAVKELSQLLPKDKRSRPKENDVTCPLDFLDLENQEQECLDNLAGYVASQVKKTIPRKNCNTTIASTAKDSKLTVLRTYNKEKMSLTVQLPAVVQAIAAAEGYICKN